MNEQKDYYNVLWVENDPAVTKTYPREAEKHYLNLKPYSCWDDAKETLEKDFDSWDAIILDAKCKHHRDSLDNAAEFLREALTEIRAICREKGRQLNWYILTGEGGAETKSINEHIPEERMKWDSDWTEQTGKKFYSKTSDEIDLLFMRVKHHANHSERTQVKMQLYRDVIGAMEYCKMPDSAIDEMVDLLYNVHMNKEGKISNDSWAKLRRVLESVFRVMIEEWGILPPEFIKTEHKDDINILGSTNFLHGETVKDSQKGIEITPNSRIITDVMFYQMKNIINYAGNLIHTKTNKSQRPDTYKKDLEEYIDAVGNSQYLIHGLTIILCDIIMWFKHYVNDHPDPNVNKNNWEITVI